MGFVYANEECKNGQYIVGAVLFYLNLLLPATVFFFMTFGSWLST